MLRLLRHAFLQGGLMSWMYYIPALQHFATVHSRQLQSWQSERKCVVSNLEHWWTNI